MTSATASLPHTANPSNCFEKSRLRLDLEALAARISSLESGLKHPQTVRDFVHPESLSFELRLIRERRDLLRAEYEQHVHAHGCDRDVLRAK
jgi:hypothetical protein